LEIFLRHLSANSSTSKRGVVGIEMNKLKLRLTKIYLKISGRKFRRIKTFKISSKESIEYVSFYEKEIGFIGQALPLLSIIISEWVFKKYSKDAQRYVLIHEYAHKKLNPLLSFISLVLCMITGLSSIILISATVATLIFFIIKGNIIFIYDSMICFAFLLMSILLFALVSWIIEAHAEIYAINMMGLGKIKKIDGERKLKKPKIGFLFNVIGKLTHPPTWLIIKIYELFHR
jgi:hypothetical protein